MRGSIFWGFILVVLGGLFLLDNLGLLPVRAWALFWPLVLIAAGALTLYGVTRRSTRPPVSQAEVPLEGAARARVRVHHGAGRLHVRAGAGPGLLASGSFAGGLKAQARRDGDLLDADLSPETDPVTFITPWHWGPGGAYDWDLSLSDAVPLDLDFETGASSTSVTLPGRPVGTCTVRIEAGAASVQATVPTGVEAFVRSESGLADVHIDRTRYLPVPGGYQTAGYASATDRLEIKVSIGVASFRLS